MSIGGNIKKYREIRGLTQPELAQKAKVSEAFLWEIENGNSKRPGAEVLYRISEVLGVTIAHLMGKEPEAPDDLVPEVNDGLRAFVEERKRQGQPLDPEEIRSLAYVQLRGGRPKTKEQWALIYGMLKEMTGDQNG